MSEHNQPETPVLIEDLGMHCPTESSTYKARYGIYKCQLCLTEFRAKTANIKSGHTNSCGCYHKKRVSETSTTHGLYKHPLYSTWVSMINRTTKPKDSRYKEYGARGITVCDRWLILENFIEDMYPTYKEELSIDRRNNDLGYSPNNCRWSTNEVQVRNTRILWKSNTSGYRGVSFHKGIGKWAARIHIESRNKHLGYFLNPLEAAKAYDSYVIANNLEHTINGV